jgi:phosphoribosyl 1,2-cyclic phosphodiesterase
MKIKFWGVRGSIPAPLQQSQLVTKMIHLFDKMEDKLFSKAELKDFLTQSSSTNLFCIGGNTSCVELLANESIIIFDMGSGMRLLGNDLFKRLPNRILDIHVFLSHTHWDHIQGFPFFGPAYSPNTKITFYSPHDNIYERLNAQHDPRFFPVKLNEMACQKSFIQLEPNSSFNINNSIVVQNIEHHHPGKSYTYRIESEGKSIVYSTDAEYTNLPDDKIQSYSDFFAESDLLIFDAQYSLYEEAQKIDWGHSSALFGLDIAIKSKVKKLALFHHDPAKEDLEIIKLLESTIKYKEHYFPNNPLDVCLAYEGLEIEV